jgi:hypothetical protein
LTSPQSNFDLSGGNPPFDLAELAAGYASGTLTPDQMDAFERRLIAGDADALREFEAVKGVGRALLLASAASVAPPAINLDSITMGSGRSGSRSASAGGGLAQWAGWLVAAACLALAAVTWISTRPAPVPQPSTFDVVALVGDAKQTALAYWAPKGPDEAPEPGAGEVIPGADAVKGAAVWSNTKQDGWVKLTGLPTNDPTQRQYQLWIIDKSQKYPIDGGTFDVPANLSSGEVAIQLKPSIRISEPVAVAVTLEKAGGVVVPDQKRRIAVGMLP